MGNELNKFYKENKESTSINRKTYSEVLGHLSDTYSELREYSDSFKDVSSDIGELLNSDIKDPIVRKAFLLGQYQALKNIVLAELDNKIDLYQDEEVKRGKIAEIIIAIGRKGYISNTELANDINGTLSSLSNLMSRNHYYFKYIQKQHLYNNEKTFYYSLTNDGLRVYRELQEKQKLEQPFARKTHITDFGRRTVFRPTMAAMAQSRNSLGYVSAPSIRARKTKIKATAKDYK